MSISIPWHPSSSSSSSSSQIKLGSSESAKASAQPQVQAKEAKQSDIWRLFREAQKNILHLNQLRLKAVEDLIKTNNEKQVLVDKIEQLELEKQTYVGKPQGRPDRLSSCWELLLRIDSMVLTGLIATEEASDLRRLVMDHKASLAELFSGTFQKTDTDLLEELRHFYTRARRNGFHIVHICTEMAPLVAVGSLASYVTGLSCVLQRKGHLVEVILPKFTYFSRASVDYIVKGGKQPDVIHIHNWETAIIGPLFWDIFAIQGLEGTRLLLTCQDLNLQCLMHPDKLALCGLDPSSLNRPDRLQDNTKSHLVNVLKILCSAPVGSFRGGNCGFCGFWEMTDPESKQNIEALAAELFTPIKVVIMSSILSKGRVIHTLSHGLDPTLNIHKNKLVVSPSGFDKFTWDPSKDDYNPHKFSSMDMDGKAVCKAVLQQRLGSPEHPSTVGFIVSAVLDDDLENMKAVILKSSKTNVQFITMGNSKASSIHKLGLLQEPLRDEQVKFINGSDEAPSHLVFAGCDIILCQSFHDPVLQVPLKSLKYGAAPIALNSFHDNFRNFAEHDYETTDSHVSSALLLEIWH